MVVHACYFSYSLKKKIKKKLRGRGRGERLLCVRGALRRSITNGFSLNLLVVFHCSLPLLIHFPSMDYQGVSREMRVPRSAPAVQKQ